MIESVFNVRLESSFIQPIMKRNSSVTSFLVTVGEIVLSNEIYTASYTTNKNEKTLAPQILDVVMSFDSTIEGIVVTATIEFYSPNGYSDISNYAFYNGSTDALLQSGTSNTITQATFEGAGFIYAIITPIQEGGSVTTGTHVRSETLALP